MSPALASSAALVAGVGALLVAGPATFERLLALARDGFAITAAPDARPTAIIAEAWSALGWSIAPPLVAAFAAALAAGIAQTQGLITLLPLAPASLRRRPTDGVWRSVGLGAVAAVATGIALHMEQTVALKMIRESGETALAATAAALGRVALRVGVAMAAAGVVDLVARRALLERSLWMTRSERERERRDDEGDPRLAAERRRRGQALGVGTNRLAEEIASSLVVVASEGVAAAIGLDGGRPILRAAGERLMAARIVDVARRLGTPIRADADLAARLAPLSSGDLVPPPLAARALALIASLHR